MPAEAPWAGERGELAVLLGRALSEHGARSAHVRVTALGARDELAVDDVPEPVSRDVLNVMVYGKQAILGPFNAAATAGAAPRPCARCLARRWQTVRSAPLRDALELGSQTVASGRLPFVTAFAADAIAALVAASRDQQRRRARSPASARVADSAAEPAAVYVLDFETLRPKRWQLASDAECPVCGLRAEDRRGRRIRLPRGAQARARRVQGAARRRLRPALRGVREPGGGHARPLCGARSDLGVHVLATVGSFLLRSGDYLRECSGAGTPTAIRQRTARPAGRLRTLRRAAPARQPHHRDRHVGGARRRPWTRAPRVVLRRVPPRNPHIKRFDPDRPIPWVWGWSLRDHGRSWYPRSWPTTTPRAA